MRFYRAHDLDLITFIETHQFNIMHAVYSALTAFADGDVFVIEIPPARDSSVEYQRIYNRVLVLDSERDQKAVELLSTVTPGYRNSFLKNLLRLYLCFPFSEDYFISSEDAKHAASLTSVFRQGRRIAQAGTIRSAKRNRIKKKVSGSSYNESTEKHEEKKAEEYNNTASHQHNAITPDSFFNVLHTDENHETEPLETDAPDNADDDINDIFNGIMNSQ